MPDATTQPDIRWHITAAEVSHDQVRDALYKALNPVGLDGMPMLDSCYVRDVYDAYVVYETPQGCYRRDYSIADDGTVTLGQPEKVQAVVSYQPVAAAEDAPAESGDSADDLPSYDSGKTYLTRLYTLLKNKIGRDEWDSAVKSARGHAGGKAPRARTAGELPTLDPDANQDDVEVVIDLLASDAGVTLSAPERATVTREMLRQASEAQPETYAAGGNIAVLIATFGKWAGGSQATCATKLAGKVANPDKVCAWLKDRWKGNTYWRGKSDAKGHGEPEQYRDYSAEERRQLAKDGKALPDGSYPIVTRADVANAVRAWGRGGATARDKAWIIKRAKALDAVDLLPDDWQPKGASDPAPTSEYVTGWSLFAELPAGNVPEWIPCLPKPGVYKHPRWGEVKITPHRNQQFIASFRDRVYQEHIPIDAEHETKLSGAMGYYRGFRVNNDGSVDAKIEWTDRGRTLVGNGQFKYFSPEWFETWSDPATGTVHTNVLTGGALTTRPYFKDANLRPLIASDSGLFAYSENVLVERDGNQMVDQDNPNRSFEAFTQDDEVSDSPRQRKDIDVADNTAPVGMTEEQARQFAELTAKVESESALRTAAEEQAKQAVERVGKLESDARHKRFTEIVRGIGGEGDGARWFGEPEKHVAMLEKLAEAFGEESDEFAHYVTTNRAYAEQLAKSDLFKTFGSDRSGEAGVLSRVQAKAEALMAADTALAYGDAQQAVFDREPQLYTEYLREQGQR